MIFAIECILIIFFSFFHEIINVLTFINDKIPKHSQETVVELSHIKLIFIFVTHCNIKPTSGKKVKLGRQLGIGNDLELSSSVGIMSLKVAPKIWLHETRFSNPSHF